ncbi:uncharacterized protein PGTG_01051 [Puccinia graminis f. sp. tritici CRL 75-36-700-3]|uniref:Uncharacterized protein n=1 Tax=Puccinia graminis f. sp. tritici (strain CRL 75-36-700-3 / race SCCL) TaxID=418459 RepID=E3JUJ5_PUCGT|nr:uncharacterized protein PGTG_01051 [Puccinia graminis f. sp. tritici CRL 75-36-700-3]EFP75720.2 hypothetical protein PGTG_01051 [Puccinia graminis f. sp. tritici CRL 75-36-700-3]
MTLVVTLSHCRLLWAILGCFTINVLAMESSRMRGFSGGSMWGSSSLRGGYEDLSLEDIRKGVVENSLEEFTNAYQKKQNAFNAEYESHNTLPFGRVLYPDLRRGRPSTVLLPGTNPLKGLGESEWTTLYTHLIDGLSKRYHEELKSLSLVKYKKEQTKLLHWLDFEIFWPQHGLPILGTSRNSYGLESIENSVLGDNQVELINYFACGTLNRHNPILEPTVTNLLKSYRDSRNHERFGDYVAACNIYYYSPAKK